MVVKCIFLLKRMKSKRAHYNLKEIPMTDNDVEVSSIIENSVLKYQVYQCTPRKFFTP